MNNREKVLDLNEEIVRRNEKIIENSPNATNILKPKEKTKIHKRNSQFIDDDEIEEDQASEDDEDDFIDQYE